MYMYSSRVPGAACCVTVHQTHLPRGAVLTIDDCTRYRVLRLYPRQNQWSSLDFLGELRRALPFPIRQLQSDNGSEFALEFSLAVQDAGIRHRYIKPRRPDQNGKVERSHRIDNEEFWGRQKSRPSPLRRRPCGRGSAPTTSSGSRWPSRAVRPPKSSPTCYLGWLWVDRRAARRPSPQPGSVPGPIQNEIEHTVRVRSLAQEILALPEPERQEFAREVLPALLTTPAGLAEIDAALRDLSDDELRALVERARQRASDLSEDEVAAIISEGLRAARVHGRP
jgi:hypothetical protein